MWAYLLLTTANCIHVHTSQLNVVPFPALSSGQSKNIFRFLRYQVFTGFLSGPDWNGGNHSQQRAAQRLQSDCSLAAHLAVGQYLQWAAMSDGAEQVTIERFNHIRVFLERQREYHSVGLNGNVAYYSISESLI
jgi:hypothetical protein